MNSSLCYNERTASGILMILALIQAYHEHKRQGDGRLMENNFVFTDVEQPMAVTKQLFISAEPQLVYEVRNCKLRGLMEALYLTAPMKSDGKFLRPAYV